MKNCSVIIVNYNTGELLKTVVDAVASNKVVDEIIIIDNNSQDASMENLLKSQRIKKYFRKKNYGFAKSCNYGRKQTHAQYLLFLNPDCLLTKDIVSSVLQQFSQDDQVAIIGCRVNNPDGTQQRASRRRLPTFWRALKTFSKLERLAKFSSVFAGVNLNHQSMPATVQSVEAISGAFMFIRAKVFDEINGFDEQFPMHFEDLDLFKRVLNNGYKIMFDPNVTVIHYQGTSSRLNPKVAQMKKQGLQKYFYKHCSRISYYLIKLINRYSHETNSHSRESRNPPQ